MHLAFDFEFLKQPWDAQAFRASAERGYALLPKGGWPNFTLGNHDKPRSAWRYRSPKPAITEARAKLAAAMLLTLKGTPFLYYGEEIGMTCRRLPKAALRDPLGIATWPLGFLGRDPERTPMQWSGASDGGFGSPSPWLPMNPDWKTRNVEAQEAASGSLLSWYRSLTKLRREEAGLRHGEIRFVDSEPEILAYERLDERSDGKILVYLNFSSRRIRIGIGKELRALLGSHRAPGSLIAAGFTELGPCEVLIAR